MPFDPTIPADHSDLDAGPVRAQLNALNDKIDAQAATIADLQQQLLTAISTITAHKVELDDARQRIATLEGQLNGGALVVGSITTGGFMVAGYQFITDSGGSLIAINSSTGNSTVIAT